MHRRSLLKSIGGIGVASALGLGGVAAFGGTAGAQTASNLSIDDTSITNDDGDLTSVAVSLGHKVDFDGFDYPVEAAAYEDYIVQLNSDGSEYARHKLYDNTNNPVMLENWSSQGNGDDGWGGPGEYNTGSGTAGQIYADVNWTVVSENPSEDAQSVESPGDAADFALDNPNDGSTKTRYFKYEKNVHLYGTRDNGSTAVSAKDGTPVYELGEDDGTVGVVESSGQFQVDVSNEEASTSGTGSGSSSAS